MCWHNTALLVLVLGVFVVVVFGGGGGGAEWRVVFLSGGQGAVFKRNQTENESCFISGHVYFVTVIYMHLVV